MILDKIVQILNAILTGLLGLLPSWDFGTSSITDAGGALGRAMSYANGFFPVTDLGACLALVVGFQAALYGWRFAVFLYDKTPFKAS